MYAIKKFKYNDGGNVPPSSPLPKQSNNGDTLPISILSESGISDNDVDKLTGSGLHTVKSVAYATKKRLLLIKGLSETSVLKIQCAAKALVQMGITTATAEFKSREKIFRLATGSKEVDKIIGGGIESCSVTEIYGEGGTGKSQLAMTLSVVCQMEVCKGGGNGRCIYIDTEGCFRTDRLIQIARRFDLNHKDVLDNILYSRVQNIDQLGAMITRAHAIIAEFSNRPASKFSLLVVDSGTGLFRLDYHGREELFVRQAHMGKHIGSLKQIAHEFKIVVVVTNQMVADVSGLVQLCGQQNLPVGGHVLAHAVTTRLALKKGNSRKRIFKLVSSPVLQEAETCFGICSGGIVDITEAD